MKQDKLKQIKQKALEEHIPIIMDDTLQEIEKRMIKNKPSKILEIGTAVGYSAICFSEFLSDNGKIDTIERDEERVEEAKKNIKDMGKHSLRGTQSWNRGRLAPSAVRRNGR